MPGRCGHGEHQPSFQFTHHQSLRSDGIVAVAGTTFEQSRRAKGVNKTVTRSKGVSGGERVSVVVSFWFRESHFTTG